MSETSRRILALDADNAPGTGASWDDVATLAREVETLEAKLAEAERKLVKLRTIATEYGLMGNPTYWGVAEAIRGILDATDVDCRTYG